MRTTNRSTNHSQAAAAGAVDTKADVGRSREVEGRRSKMVAAEVVVAVLRRREDRSLDNLAEADSTMLAWEVGKLLREGQERLSEACWARLQAREEVCSEGCTRLQALFFFDHDDPQTAVAWSYPSADRLDRLPHVVSYLDDRPAVVVASGFVAGFWHPSPSTLRRSSSSERNRFAGECHQRPDPSCSSLLRPVWRPRGSQSTQTRNPDTCRTLGL